MPTFAGDYLTNARLFTDALATRRWMRANKLEVPDELSQERIRKRFLSHTREVMERENGDRMITFLDDSKAIQQTGDVWRELV